MKHQVTIVRTGFVSLEDAQHFMNMLMYPDQFIIEEIIDGPLNDPDTDTLAYCVVPKGPSEH
jgi:hypothetical protein